LLASLQFVFVLRTKLIYIGGKKQQYNYYLGVEVHPQGWAPLSHIYDGLEVWAGVTMEVHLYCPLLENRTIFTYW